MNKAIKGKPIPHTLIYSLFLKKFFFVRIGNTCKVVVSFFPRWWRMRHDCIPGIKTRQDDISFLSFSYVKIKENKNETAGFQDM